MRFCFLALLLAGFIYAETVCPIPNGDFEKKENDWQIQEKISISRISNTEAASGKFSLLIEDKDEKEGSGVRSARIPLIGISRAAVRGKVFAISGSGLGIYVRQFDAKGNPLPGETHIGSLGGTSQRWEKFANSFYTVSECAAVELWLHSYSHAKVKAYLDDLEFVILQREFTQPWKGKYKIKANEPGKMTDADILAPDGIVYPNWSRTGVDGGIPKVPVKEKITNFAAKADDNLDDSAAFTAACEKVGETGGGAILLEPGTYYLDNPVSIRHSGVVIRGAGREQTKIIFRYALPASGIRFYGLAKDNRVSPDDRIEVHATPKSLQLVQIFANEKLLRTWKRGKHSGNSFRVGFSMRGLFQKIKSGPCELRVEASYENGEKKALSEKVELVPDLRRTPAPNANAVFYFSGAFDGKKLLLAKDGERGSRWLELKSSEGLARGDKILIEGPATKRWKALTQNQCLWGSYRRYEVRIVRVEGNRIRIEQPLRLDFPIIDGSYVRKMAPIEWCGMEDMEIEQTENLWINTVEFNYAWNCWGKNLKVKMTGRFPVHAKGKWCEIRDCIFDDAWFKGGGGTAYAGWQNSFDCLMENVETFNFRHAPLVQWAASGNVIRNGIFHNSDAQWHSGWTNENLFENCVVFSRRGHGGYGYGMWASPPEDTAHGPNGPRNVVYNCDINSTKDGLWMGGMNENWLILHNRFIVENGSGVFAKTASFDHILQGNTFVIKNKKFPGIHLATPDCLGVEVKDNTVFGAKELSSPGVKFAQEKNNLLKELATPLPDRPQPKIPSIYEWQQKHVKWSRELPIR